MSKYYFTADKWYGPLRKSLPSGPSLIPEFAGMVKEEGKDFFFEYENKFPLVGKSYTIQTAVPVAEEVVKIEHLLNMLAQYGGTIESTGAMDEMNIKQARASGRLYVDEHSLGYVWMPGNFKGGPFPETVEDVELFDTWFP